MPALILILKLASATLAAWITWRAFQQSLAWGLLFLLSPLLFVLLQPVAGGAIALAILALLPLPFIYRHRLLLARSFLLTVVLLAMIGLLTRGTFRGPLP